MELQAEIPVQLERFWILVYARAVFRKQQDWIGCKHTHTHTHMLTHTHTRTQTLTLTLTLTLTQTHANRSCYFRKTAYAYV